jgi:phage gp16-like protein
LLSESIAPGGILCGHVAEGIYRVICSTRRNLQEGGLMSKDFPPAMRKNMIAKIHVAKTQLGMDEEAYRDLLESVTQKRSCADMDERELHLVLEAMRRVGFKPFFPATKDKDVKTQVDKIRALWLDLAKAELVPDGEPALLGFVKRQTKVDRLEWLTPKQCNSVIEALKAIQSRSLDSQA